MTEPSSADAPSNVPGFVLPQTEQDETATNQMRSGKEADSAQAAETWLIPTWDEKAMHEKYTALVFAGIEYGVGRSSIAETYLGEKLGVANLMGYDVYTEHTYEMSLNVYKLNEVSTECALGVRFDNGTCYAYVNAKYMPATLSQFLRDLNLKNELRFGEAYAEYYDKDNNYHALVFADFDDAVVWEQLLSDDLPVQEIDVSACGRKLVDVAVAVPELGYTNQGMWVTEDGYVVTNLLETAKVFYVGADRAKAFRDWLFVNVGFEEADGFAAEPFSENPE